MESSDPRLHFVTATAIIAKKEGNGPTKFLILKRAPTEKAFPNKWTVPGGKLVRTDYENWPSKADYPQHYNILDWLVRKEVREEASLEIGDLHYLTDLVFVRPDGNAVVTISYWAYYKSGEVKLNHEMTEFAWITAGEAKNYNFIKGIDEEIETVDTIIRK